MNKIICPNCGNDMIDKSVGDAINVVCPHCGNGWVAYDDREKEAIYSDKCEYQLFIDESSIDSSKLKILSNVVGTTMLNLKKAISLGESVLSMRAHEIKPILKELKKNGFAFRTVPEFKHNIE